MVGRAWLRPGRGPDGAADGGASAIAEVAAPVPGGLARGEDEDKPRPHRIRGLAVWAVYLGLIAASIVFAGPILSWALDSPYPMATVTSGSMWPVLKEGDVVLLQGVDDIGDLEEGDIIAFRHQDGMAIHRIVSIEGDEIVTKGDANPVLDRPITFDAVIARAFEIKGQLIKIPYLGHVGRLVGPITGTNANDP